MEMPVSAPVEAEFSLPQWQERFVNLGFGRDVALRGRGSILHPHYGIGMTNRKWAPLTPAPRLSRGPEYCIKRGDNVKQ